MVMEDGVEQPSEALIFLGLSLGCEPNGRRNQQEEEERIEEGRSCVSRAWHVPHLSEEAGWVLARLSP